MTNIVDLVEQTSTTTGTGAYTLSGSVASRRTFLAAFVSDAPLIPCVVVASDGSYETGIYSFTASTQVLARTTIISSSNGNAAVSWPAGTRHIYCGASAAMSQLNKVRHELGAASDPVTASPQTTDGYDVGSLWFYPSTATLSIGVAISGSTVLFEKILTVDSAGNLLTDGVVASGIVSGGYSYAYSNTGHVAGGGVNASDGGFTSFADGFDITMYGRTSNGTAKNIAFNDDAGGSILPFVETGAAMRISALVVATVDGGATKEWEVTALVKNTQAGTLSIVGQTSTSLYSTGTTTGWAVTLVNTGSNFISLHVTGATGQEVTWGAQIRGVHAGRG